MEDLELRVIARIATRHAAGAHDELREEGQIKTGEDQEAADASEEIVVHPAKKLGPPVEHSAEEGGQRATHHHEVEVSDHEVSVMQVNVRRKGCEEQTGQTANPEQENEREGVAHRGVQGD